MLPLLMEDDIPEFLLQRSSIAYGNTLHLQVGRQRLRSTLVLCRNLKFYEFRKKELLHHIDLGSDNEIEETKELQRQLENYKGPLSSFLIREDLDQYKSNEAMGSLNYSMLQAVEDQPIEIGKYVWLGDHVYVLIRCWATLIVLLRPVQHGAKFELMAIHRNFKDYQLVNGPVQYQAYVQLNFRNGKRLLTNFESPDKLDVLASSSSCRLPRDRDSSDDNFKSLLLQVHELRCQLSAQLSQTLMDMTRAQDLQAFGVPGQRSLLLDEKQILRRFGDIWTRVCPGDRLVIGCMLANISGTQRLSIIHNVQPVLQLAKVGQNGGGISWTLDYRLYELPRQPNGQPPEDYNELAQFWSCQEQEQQYSHLLNWRPISASISSSLFCHQNQLMPECNAVLVICLQLADLLEVEKLELLVSYEVGLKGSSRQLHVSTIDVASLLSQPELHAPSFKSESLHQDFLAVIMSQPAQCALCLEFLPDQKQQVGKFEQLLVSSLGFELSNNHKATVDRDPAECETNFLDDIICSDNSSVFDHHSRSDEDSVQRIFYNRQSTSQWCGLLLIRRQDHLWHMYAQSFSKIRLFLYRLQRDLLQLNCNLSLLELDDQFNGLSAFEAAIHLEATLRVELNIWRRLMGKLKQDEMKHWTRQLNQMQMLSDKMATVIESKSEEQQQLD
ncbi:uncharacterized protein Dwil_GK19854 [Drosophila willistoni]|uniref:Uncharacterized protein n=1 Tax=Drosophila willistoni TaxID=7260 RepID=B4MSR1_DROWI|nr:uncharacterized protein LOC6641441 [Drosophila willistoni]EDW75150.1 uncharacterized protein Dwil_GK19854 [Drosophila willistoni]